MVDLTFLIPVAGLATDAARRQVAERYAPHELLTCDLWQLTQRLCELPPATINLIGTRSGDPLSLCVIADYETILSACTARWNECETIAFGTYWKTSRAFLWGVEDRDSPVSPLYLFGCSQDPTLQRIRHSINERLHRRLWLTPLRFAGRPFGISQIGCDIGVRFTTQTWNLTTHWIDPNVDESRDYLGQDLLRAQRIEAEARWLGDRPARSKRRVRTSPATLTSPTANGQ